MAVEDTDLLIVERGDVPHRATVAEVREGAVPSENIAVTSKASLGTVNINPLFALGNDDYGRYIDGDNRKVVFDEAYQSSGSLYVKGAGGTLLTSTIIPPNYGREYRAVMTYKCSVNGKAVPHLSTFAYVGFAHLDADATENVDAHRISPQHITEIAGTQTRLAADVKTGDTTVIIEDGSNWYSGATSHRRSILLHKLQPNGTAIYTGNNGRKYDHLGYSRHNAYRSYDAGAISQNPDGTYTIALSSPWALGNFKKGDYVRNSFGGGTFTYLISNKSIPVDNEWHTYKSAWTSHDDTLPIQDYINLFRNGTAYMQMIVLPNYRFRTVVTDACEDLSWSGNHGTYKGGATLNQAGLLVNDANDKSVLFDGIGKFLEFTNPVPMGENFTLTFVLEFNALTSSYTSLVYADGADRINIFVQGTELFINQGTSLSTGHTTLQVDTPYTITIVKDGDVVNAYVNGVIGTAVTLPPNGHLNASTMFYINAETQDININVSSILCFDKPLTEAQILKFHELAFTANNTGETLRANALALDPVGLYEMNEPDTEAYVNPVEPDIPETWYANLSIEWRHKS
jgi:hypothetical protein